MIGVALGVALAGFAVPPVADVPSVAVEHVAPVAAPEIAQEIAATPVPVWAGYPACEHEDSDGPCYWDAATRGNGLGTSFYVTADQVVVYLDES